MSNSQKCKVSERDCSKHLPKSYNSTRQKQLLNSFKIEIIPFPYQENGRHSFRIQVNEYIIYQLCSSLLLNQNLNLTQLKLQPAINQP